MPLHLVSALIDESAPAAPPDHEAAEGDHRIANNLMIIAGLIRSQAARLPATPTLPTDDVRAWLQEMAIRIDAVGRLHGLLRQRDGAAVLDLAAYLREVAQAAMASLTHAERTELAFDLAPGCDISAKQAAAIGLLVAEAMTNAFKYSHPSGIAGKLRLSAQRSRDCGLVIEVVDDGVGLPEGFDTKNGKSNGFRVMRAAADQLHGRLAFEQGPIGLCVRLELPPDGARKKM
jgi:two-component sensor histidine kinase